MRSPSGVRRCGKLMPGCLCCGFGAGADSAALSASVWDTGSLAASAAAPAAVCQVLTLAQSSCISGDVHSSLPYLCKFA